MYQAGTLSGNPLAMTAGIKTLEILARPGAYEHLQKVTKMLVDGLVEAGLTLGMKFVGVTSAACLDSFSARGLSTILSRH